MNTKQFLFWGFASVRSMRDGRMSPRANVSRPYIRAANQRSLANYRRLFFVISFTVCCSCPELFCFPVSLRQKTGPSSGSRSSRHHEVNDNTTHSLGSRPLSSRAAMGNAREFPIAARDGRGLEPRLHYPTAWTRFLEARVDERWPMTSNTYFRGVSVLISFCFLTFKIWRGRAGWSDDGMSSWF